MRLRVGAKFTSRHGHKWTILRLDFPLPGRVQVQDDSGNRFDVSASIFHLHVKSLGFSWFRKDKAK